MAESGLPAPYNYLPHLFWGTVFILSFSGCIRRNCTANSKRWNVKPRHDVYFYRSFNSAALRSAPG
jgi:hypothetical protein